MRTIHQYFISVSSLLLSASSAMLQILRSAVLFSRLPTCHLTLKERRKQKVSKLTPEQIEARKKKFEAKKQRREQRKKEEAAKERKKQEAAERALVSDSDDE